MTSSAVYWFTGLSGAGKTTVGRIFCELLRKAGRSVIFLDGDALRDVFGNDLGHTRDDRMKCAMRYSRLCKMLSEQGFDVVCATISMFHDCREWNRANIQCYKEIYVKVPLSVLIERDPKQLYSRALRGELRDVAGIDVAVEEPVSPDVVLDNDGTVSPELLAQAALSKLSAEGA